MPFMHVKFEDIEDIKFDHEKDLAWIQIFFDDAWYSVDKTYYERSMKDRGFVRIDYQD